MSTDKKFSSLLFALLICCQMFNMLLPYLFKTNLSYGGITMFIIWSALIIYLLLFDRHIIKSLSSLLFISLYIFSLILSNYFLKTEHLRLLSIHFFEYSFLAYIIAQINFDVELVLRYSGYFLLISVPLLSTVFNISPFALFNTDYYDMSTSYVMMPPVFSIIVHFLFYRKKKDFFMYLSYFFASIILIQLFMFGTRGFAFSAICLFILCIFHFFYFKLNRFQYNTLIFMLFAGSYALYYFIYPLLFKILEYAPSFRFINKSITLLEKDNIANGRDYLYELSFNDFLSSPVLGNGIGYFDYSYDLGYQHNLFLQLLSEGGLLLFIPIAIILFVGIKNLLYPKIPFNSYIILLLTFCLSVPRLFFSSEIWKTPLIWALFSFIFVLNNQRHEQDTVQ